MKRFTILFIITALTSALFIQMNSIESNKKTLNDNAIEEYKFPQDVKKVIDKSCYGCHSENGKSDDAKDALRWDKMADYDKAKLVAVMDGIIETIEKEEMPPKKMVEKKPEIKPTAEEYKTLLKWAEAEADELLK